tara:strand:+ start:520 stop:999 length:480 start_codon:yes stop_codon:yes gene_type:complete
MKYLIVKKSGNVEEKQTRLILQSDNIYKLCGYKSPLNVELIHTFHSQTTEGVTYQIYGKKEGRANSENKYELPPPVDTILLFGTLCIIKTKMNNVDDLTKSEWSDVYDNLFGGFEVIEETDDERSVDTEDYSDSEYTKEGYHKDSFIVEDQELEQEEYI